MSAFTTFNTGIADVFVDARKRGSGLTVFLRLGHTMIAGVSISDINEVNRYSEVGSVFVGTLSVEMGKPEGDRFIEWCRNGAPLTQGDAHG